MPKATLTFELPEEHEEYDTAMSAGKYYSALFDFANYLRSVIKYQEKETWPDAEAIREKFWETLKDCEVDL